MRYYEILLEYNIQSLIKILGPALFSKWEQEGNPFANKILPDNPDNIQADDLIRWIEQYDPSQNKQYMTWIIQKYTGKKNGIKRFEDIPTRTHSALDQYMRLSRKKQLNPEHKDINQIKTLFDLEDVVDQYKEKETVSKSEKTDEIEQNFYKSGEAELVYNDNEYKIVIPNSHKANCYFGKNTKWCTASDSEEGEEIFHEYSDYDSLYIILHKPTNKRWQWSFATQQYMDERDNPIDMFDFIKKHKNAVNSIVKHHGIEKIVSMDGDWLQYIKNPSPEIQWAAVKHDWSAIQYIKNPSPKMQIAVVKENGKAIQYIKNPSPEIQWAAVKQDGYAIQYIKNPSPKMQMTAVKENGKAIQYIKNPSPEIQWAAVKRDGYAIQYIKNPSPKMQMTAVKGIRHAIQFIKDPSPEVLAYIQSIE